MSPPRRRSARLASPKKRSLADTQVSKLSSLIEREEQPNEGIESRLDAIMATPITKKKGQQNESVGSAKQQVTTPKQSMGRFKLPLDEMHPSKTQQSTQREPSSALRFGFTDPKVKPDQSTLSKIQTYQNTPSKSRVVLNETSEKMSSKFESIDKELGPEAQKMMQDLREEAAKIKQKMLEEREKSKMEKGDTPNDPNSLSPRKIAVPKGKKGRFSDVHMAQFKKMDSIANHPSAFRSQLARTPDALTSLKRKKSQADLGTLSTGRSATKQSGDGNSSKLPKTLQNDVHSQARPVSRHGPSLVPVASSRTGLMTPTKSSLARAGSLKTARTIAGAFGRMSPTKLISNIPRSEGNPRYFNALSPLGKVKSLLRSPQRVLQAELNPSRTQERNVTGIKLDLNKKLPSVPSVPSVPGTPASGIPRAKSATSLSKPCSKPSQPQQPSTDAVVVKARSETAQEMKEGEKELEAAIEYPKIPVGLSSPAPMRVARPKLTPRTPRPRPSGPHDFTFRSEKIVRFGQPNASTIRTVRPSTGTTDRISYPIIAHGLENKKRHRDDDSENEENIEPLAKKPKGPEVIIPEKKREVNKLRKIQSVSPVKNRSPTKSKGILSLSRLNALARPKGR